MEAEHPKQPSNVDHSEIQKFNDHAEKWWNPDGELRTLHDINPVRAQWIDDLAILRKKNALDVGCGGGLLSEAMARRGAMVTAIDMAEDVINVARHHATLDDLAIDYRVGTIEGMLTPPPTENSPSQFDVITCLEMLEHVPNPNSIISACASLLKPNGLLFLSTLNRNIKSFLMAIVGAEYLMNLIPRGTHDYKRLIKPSELSRLCRSHGLTIKSIAGLQYNPISRRASICNSLSVNYLLCAQKHPQDEQKAGDRAP